MFRDLSKKKWKNCILETTGLNARETFLKVALPFPQRVIVKLDAQRKVLYGRIGKKRRREQGGEWTFSADYPDKFEFVRKLYKQFKKVPSDITIDTTRLEPQKVFQIALKKIENYRMMYSHYDWPKDEMSSTKKLAHHKCRLRNAPARSRQGKQLRSAIRSGCEGV